MVMAEVTLKMKVSITHQSLALLHEDAAVASCDMIAGQLSQ